MIETEAVVAQGTLKAVCSRDELTRALGIVSRGVSTRTSVQILAGILLEADDGKLQLAATDMELSLRTSLEANVEAAGSVVVPGRLLLEMMSEQFDLRRHGGSVKKVKHLSGGLGTAGRRDRHVDGRARRRSHAPGAPAGSVARTACAL